MKKICLIIVLFINNFNTYSQSEFGFIAGGSRTTNNFTYKNYLINSNNNSVNLGCYFKTDVSSQISFEPEIFYMESKIGKSFKFNTIGIPVLFGLRFSKSTLTFGPELDLNIDSKFNILNANFKDKMDILGVMGFMQKINNKIGVNLRYGKLFYDSYTKSVSGDANSSFSSNRFSISLFYKLSNL